MSNDEYEIFDLMWSGRITAVCHQTNWLDTGHWQIELRCNGHLPLTETGHRSNFVPQVEFADQDETMTFVTELLDEAAQSKDCISLPKKANSSSFSKHMDKRCF